MTTATPTGDAAGAAESWLPDEATLARLANEFFAAPPAEQPVTALTSHVPAAAVPPGQDPVRAASYEPVITAPSQDPVRAASYEPVITAGGPGAVPPLRPPGQLAGQAFDLPRLAQAAVPSFYFVDDVAAAGLATPAFSPGTQSAFDIEGVRRDFPILAERVNGRQLVWLDNAATTQKPQAVIDRLDYFYSHENSNVHRAAHALAARSTDAYEGARVTIADYIGAPSSDTIVFTRGATEAINLVARAWGPQHLAAGDEIVISQLEHHANIVPWQQLAAQTGAKLKVIPVGDDGQLLLDAYADLLTHRTRLVAVSQVSNVLGTIVPVSAIVEAAHRVGATVLIDGAQAVAHLPLDVSALNIDFYVFSGHKIFAPTGIGVLYGKPEILESMPPWQGGGNMIEDVTFERTTYQHPPARFEAGTGSIADAVALGTALDYVSRIGLPEIARYERDLLSYATQEICSVPGLRLIGTAPEKASVLSFVLAGYTPEE
ncbi:MAG: aminotransferase class V-fold PLP-dependent enzyme, partial [Streptosporangiaceae bacterium]